MVAAFFLILAVMLLLIRFSVSSQVGRVPSEDAHKEYALGAQRSLSILKYAAFACLGVAALALLAQLVLSL
jgi:hypothetical protein